LSPCACCRGSGQKSQCGLITLGYQDFTALLLLIYGSLFLSGVYYCLSVFCVLHCNNAPAHTALSVREFLASKQITVLEHALYSQDLAPNDFALFPKIKEILKGRHFCDIDSFYLIAIYNLLYKWSNKQICYKKSICAELSSNVDSAIYTVLYVVRVISVPSDPLSRRATAFLVCV
jgi:hypothetical protein